MATDKTVNGVAVEELGRKAAALKKEPELAQFVFRVANEWENCGYNRTTVKGFYGIKQEQQHAAPFVLEADEPPTLLGTDRGANPVEHLLNALVTCLTTSMIYHAAVRGITISALESTAEGRLDVRGFMGIAPDVRKGYQDIQVKFRVKSDGSPEELKECARFSPVFDVVSRGTNVTLEVEKQ